MSKAKTSLSRIAGLSVLVLLLGGLGLGLKALGETTNLRAGAANSVPACERFKSIKIESCGNVAWLAQTNQCKTETRDVQIKLNSPGAIQMRFKEIDPKATCALTDSGGWTDWENYAVKKDFKLSAGYGNKRVCVSFINGVGESRCAGNIKYVKNKPGEPTTQEGSSKLCSSKGNSASVCNGRKVGEDAGPCTCVYSSLGGSDCKCIKKDEAGSCKSLCQEKHGYWCSGTIGPKGDDYNGCKDKKLHGIYGELEANDPFYISCYYTGYKMFDEKGNYLGFYSGSGSYCCKYGCN